MQSERDYGEPWKRDQSGFDPLVELVPTASKPQSTVIVLTLMTDQGVWELVTQRGTYVCSGQRPQGGRGLESSHSRGYGAGGTDAEGGSGGFTNSNS